LLEGEHGILARVDVAFGVRVDDLGQVDGHVDGGLRAQLEGRRRRGGGTSTGGSGSGPTP
jgi:hypothetical protein